MGGVTLRRLVWETEEGKPLKCALFGPQKLQTLSSHPSAEQQQHAELKSAGWRFPWSTVHQMFSHDSSVPGFRFYCYCVLGCVLTWVLWPKSYALYTLQIISTNNNFTLSILFLFSSSSKAAAQWTPHKATQKHYFPWVAYDFTFPLPKHTAGHTLSGVISRAWQEGHSHFRRFPRMGDAGQLNRLWSTTGCSANDLSIRAGCELSQKRQF